MTAVYDKLGVRFIYPENWQVVDEEASDWPRAVTVQSPQGDFWTLSIYPPPVEREDLAEAVVEAMREEYKELEAEQVELKIADAEAVGYDMNFYCLDMVVSSAVRVFRLGVRTMVVLYQAENRDFDRLLPVFEAITQSLVRDTDANEDE